MNIAKYIFRRALRISAPKETNESYPEFRFRVWHELSADIAALVNPLAEVSDGTPLPDNLEWNYYPHGTISFANDSGEPLKLDTLADAPDDPNLVTANQGLMGVTQASALPKDIWIWYVQAGHNFLNTGRFHFALRAYLNERRVRRHFEPDDPGDGVMSENIATALQELGDFDNAALHYIIAAESYLQDHRDEDAATAFESAGLAWERGATGPERQRLGTDNGMYDSTICFRRAKYLYSAQGDFDGSSRTTILEREASRRWSRSLTRRLTLTAMRHIWLYGESPLHVLRNAAVVWFLAAIVYFCAGFSMTDGHTTGRLGFGNALYFSGITMTTVGYGDAVPKSCVSKATAVGEGISGILFGSMFLVAMQRRFAGR